MMYLVIYDISSNLLRNRVAEVLKDYGLTRVQLSGFLGQLPRHRLNSLLAELEKLLESSRAAGRKSIQVYPLCRSCFKARVNLGDPPEVREKPITV